jgi:ankyrin repeat protein
MADGGQKSILPVTSVSPLSLAAMTGSMQGMADALTAGAKVGDTDNNGWTALHFAASMGQTAVVAFLLAQGADPLAKAKDGATAKSMAMANGAIDAMVVLDKAEQDGQVIRAQDMPDHIKDLKRQVADLTEKFADLSTKFNDLAARLPQPAEPAPEAPTKKPPGLIIR